jgi:transcriptional accessory protein Tex/SPT6
MSEQDIVLSEENVEVAVEEALPVEAAELSSNPSTAQTDPESESTPAPEAEEERQAEAPVSDEPAPSTDQAKALSGELSIHTLKMGQHLPGRVKNITSFGAFVDIGIPQDGLVHISKLSRHKVDKVTDVVSEGQEVDVWVKKVDKKRGRISLTMVKPVKLRLKDIEEGAEIDGTVTRLESYGAFVDIGSDRDGLVHISQVTHDYIKHPNEALAVGDSVAVKILKVNRKKRQVDLSIKALLPPPVEEVKAPVKFEPVSEAESKAEADEPVPTAMALAYAAFQNWDDDGNGDVDENSDAGKTKDKKREEMDAIVARTLATRED